MSSTHFIFDPGQYGLPDLGQLKDYRIWSIQLPWFKGLDPFEQNEGLLFYVKHTGLEWVISLDTGHTGNLLVPFLRDARKLEYMEMSAISFPITKARNRNLNSEVLNL